jgi:MFS family permease
MMRVLLFLVGAVLFFETVFFSALAPLLPTYAHELGLSKLEAGVLVACYAAGGLVGALPGGFLALRLGVKPTMLAGLGLLCLLSVAFGFARSAWLFDLSRFGQGIGAAFAWTGGLAWLVTEAPRERRGAMIGMAMGAVATGAVLGPAVGAAATLVGAKPTFLVVALLGGALAVWALSVPGPAPLKSQSLWLLAAALRRPGIAIGLWLVALPSLMLGVLDVLVPLRLGALGLSGSAIGAVFISAAALLACTNVALGGWGDRSGRELPLRASLVASVLACLVLPLGRNDWGLAVLAFFAATAFGSFFAPAMALLSDQIDRAGLEHALGFALLIIAWAPSHVVGSAGGGALGGAAGDSVPYLLLALLCGLSLPVLRHLLRLERTLSPAIQQGDRSADEEQP